MRNVIIFLLVLLLMAVPTVQAADHVFGDDLWHVVNNGDVWSNQTIHPYLNCSFMTNTDAQVIINGSIYKVDVLEGYTAVMQSFVFLPGSTIQYSGLVGGTSRCQVDDYPVFNIVAGAVLYQTYLPLAAR